ncbi:AraC family transcriptional regulator [Paraburkholderia silviterrae]|uniref:AraC family transcriptional regulator n=1 Tax=Paraburkholderia silviterrae TaxID=2528715 RepID=A0A4R5LXG2_9BURK|nr:AraC family transcriptional regulator [Paraburkholderia silviterrae]TDG16591.1 AraC family transcriptional regulator [Paraburkholderia silviterrae]
MQGYLPSVVLTGAAPLLEALGVQAELIATGADLPELALRSTDVPIRGAQVLRFLSLAAEVTRCRDFGLRLSEYQGLAVLGPILVMMQGMRTIGEAMETLAEFYVLHTSMSSVRAVRDEQGMVLTYDLENAAGPGEVQAIELGLANGMRYLRTICGTDWQPAVVQFRHAAPADCTMHWRTFGSSLRFDQDRNAIVLDHDTVRRPITHFRRNAHRVLEAHLRRERAQIEALWVVRTQAVIRALLPFTDSSLSAIARALAISPRTLQRRLSEAGTSFDEIREEVREDLAVKYVQQSNLPLAEISEMLGYSQQSAFSRAFKRLRGMTPRQLRAKCRGTDGEHTDE